jgi:hypothetical protein
MAGLVPAIHAETLRRAKRRAQQRNVNARDKRGHESER